MLRKIIDALSAPLSEDEQRKVRDEQLKRVAELCLGLVESRGAAPLSRANQLRLAESYLFLLREDQRLRDRMRAMAKEHLDYVTRERDQELIDRYNAFVVGVRVGIEKGELGDEELRELFAGCEGDRIRAERERTPKKG